MPQISKILVNFWNMNPNEQCVFEYLRTSAL